MLKGIDVSKWQGDINWDAASKNIDFACIRASIIGSSYADNDYVDHKFYQNWEGAKKNELPVSAYFVHRPDIDYKFQVNKFLDAIYGLKNNFPWVIDVELDGAKNPGEITRHLILCLNYLKDKTGQLPMIYTGAWYWNVNIIEGAEQWDNYKLWTASYTTKAIIPKGWKDYDVWQYTSSGKIDGVKGAVDLNYAKDNLLYTPEDKEDKQDSYILKNECPIYNDVTMGAQLIGMQKAGSKLDFEYGYFKTPDGWLFVTQKDL